MKAVDKLENQTKPFIAHGTHKNTLFGRCFHEINRKKVGLKIDSLVLYCDFNILLVKILWK